MVAVRRASIPSEQLDCRGCSTARLARSTRASGTSRRGSTRIPPSTSRRSTRSGRPTTAVPRPRDRQPLDHAVRTAVPAYRVHVGGLPPRWPLGQVLAVLAAQVPLPPQRRGVQCYFKCLLHARPKGARRCGYSFLAKVVYFLSKVVYLRINQRYHYLRTTQGTHHLWQ